MKLLLEQSGIAWLGLITTLLVVITDIVFLRWTGFSLVGTLIVYVVPIGSIVGGMLAASGYYLGARYTHSRATPFLLVLMVVIAGLAYFLIYWLDYTHREIGETHDFRGFVEFVNQMLTNTRIAGRVVRTGNVGIFGYLLGLIDFIGFLLGGFVVYVFLSSEHVCPSCNLYLNTLYITEREFSDIDDLASYIAGVEARVVSQQIPVDMPETLVAATPKSGSTRVLFALSGCRFCKYQIMERKVSIRNGEDWDYIEALDRTFQVPPGVDAKPYLQ
jgi:hypothetical protein